MTKSWFLPRNEMLELLKSPWARPRSDGLVHPRRNGEAPFSDQIYPRSVDFNQAHSPRLCRIHRYLAASRYLLGFRKPSDILKNSSGVPKAFWLLIEFCLVVDGLPATVGILSSIGRSSSLHRNSIGYRKAIWYPRASSRPNPDSPRSG